MVDNICLYSGITSFFKMTEKVMILPFFKMYNKMNIHVEK